MKVYTIYFNPTDFPGLYVLRAWGVYSGRPVPDEHCETANSLDEIRKFLPEEVVWIGRYADDDPKIVECWI